MAISKGDVFEHEVRFTQADVDAFVQLSGDSNIIHSDAEAAHASPIGTIAIPGMLAALAFSKVMGTLFPGHRTVYRSQSLKFRLPVLLDVPYEVSLLVVKVVIKHHAAFIETTLRNKEDGSPCITGRALVLHPELFV